VQLAGGRPDQFAEALLDMHVDVLERRILDQSASGIFLGDPVEPIGDCPGLLAGEDSLRPKHGRMRL
jgi:hypothetical protein